MDLLDKQIGKDVELQVSIVDGKVVLVLKVSAKEAVDKLLEDVKPKLPEWLQPLIDLGKGEVDKVLA